MINGLPEDKHGRKIPWFVAVDEDGVPDHRIARAEAIREATTQGLCWLCGIPRGKEAAFVIGPMCTVNRVAPEPPSHFECARYAADACPFLSTPNMRRRDSDLPEDRLPPSGYAIARNPGVIAVWYARDWEIFRAPGGSGVLFDIGDPRRVYWRTRGRAATQAEVLASFATGLPTILDAAISEGVDSVADLQRRFLAALELAPAA